MARRTPLLWGRQDPSAAPRRAAAAAPQALAHAGLDKEKDEEAFGKLDKTRCGILVGSGMGGLTVFQDGAPPGVARAQGRGRAAWESAPRRPRTERQHALEAVLPAPAPATRGLMRRPPPTPL